MRIVALNRMHDLKNRKRQQWARNDKRQHKSATSHIKGKP